MKQFQKESTAARKILDGIKNSLGNFDAETTGIDDKARQRIIEVNNAMPLARSAAFALALAKNTDVADFFFDASEVSNQAFKNFDQAYDEIQQDYRDREFEGDSLMSNIAPLQRMAGPTRAYYIMGMSTEDAVEELMRLSKDELQKAVDAVERLYVYEKVGRFNGHVLSVVNVENQGHIGGLFQKGRGTDYRWHYS